MTIVHKVFICGFAMSWSERCGTKGFSNNRWCRNGIEMELSNTKSGAPLLVDLNANRENFHFNMLIDHHQIALCVYAQQWIEIYHEEIVSSTLCP
jgi:hypothetical protein